MVANLVRSASELQDIEGFVAAQEKTVKRVKLQDRDVVGAAYEGFDQGAIWGWNAAILLLARRYANHARP